MLCEAAVEMLIICRMRASLGVGMTVPVVMVIFPLAWQLNDYWHRKGYIGLFRDT